MPIKQLLRNLFLYAVNLKVNLFCYFLDLPFNHPTLISCLPCLPRDK